MTEYYADFNINLDARDSEGKPKYSKTPKGPIRIFEGDTLHLTVSIIENGVEKELGVHKLKSEQDQYRQTLSVTEKR